MDVSECREDDFEEAESPEDTFKILVATDCHLGYGEKDAIRGNDSIVTFEEILQNAKKYDVDFILLGGDLYHDNKPSRWTVHSCMKLIRKYCMNDKPVQFDFLSDPKVNFADDHFPHANYEDPNLNVGIPIFSVHGNHDDPAGKGNLSAIDELSVCGLLNHFGRHSSLEKIEVSPVLLQKGETKLALYGMGSVRDERMYRLFTSNNVTMLRPSESEEDWFNLLTIHQNRSKHGETNYIPEQFLDNFLDLIIWGHEHECRIDPEWNGNQDFYVCQPGSSVATSLAEGEAVPKHIGILQVYKKEFKMTKIPLLTVRPFYIEDVFLGETKLNPDDVEVTKKVEAYCQQKVQSIIDRAALERTGSPLQPEMPLIRLKVELTGFEMFSQHRFAQNFVNKVANPKDIIRFYRKKIPREKMKQDPEALQHMIEPIELDTTRVEDLVKKYFTKAEKASQLQLLTEKGIGDAVKEYVDKEEKEAISELVKYQVDKTQKHLKERNSTTEDITEQVSLYKEERKQKSITSQVDEDKADLEEALKLARKRKPKSSAASLMDSDEDLMNDDSSDAPTTSKRGRGSQRGRATTRGRGRGRGRGSRGASNTTITASFSKASRKKETIAISESEEDEIMISDDEPPPPKKKATTARGRKAIQYDDDDDDDDIEFASSSRKRKR